MKKLRSLTIVIEDVSDKDGKGYCAKILELNNSLICADKLEDIFKLIPDVLEVSKKDNIGIFASPSKKTKAQNTHAI